MFDDLTHPANAYTVIGFDEPIYFGIFSSRPGFSFRDIDVRDYFLENFLEQRLSGNIVITLNWTMPFFTVKMSEFENVLGVLKITLREQHMLKLLDIAEPLSPEFEARAPSGLDA